MTAPDVEDLLALEDEESAGRRTAVYRFFNADGRLLYVGITHYLLARWRWHEKNADWWPQQHRVEVVWHETRADAEKEETRAVLNEQPVHNIAKRGKTPRVSFRMDEACWDALGDKAAEIGLDRSAVVRALVDWFRGIPGAELPARPWVAGEAAAAPPQRGGRPARVLTDEQRDLLLQATASMEEAKNLEQKAWDDALAARRAGVPDETLCDETGLSRSTLNRRLGTRRSGTE